MKIVRFQFEDIKLCREAADLHIKSIHLGLLPLLGKRFMTEMYRFIAVAPQSGVWAIVDNGKFVGYIAGCADVHKTYRWILLNHGFSLSLSAGFILARLTVLKKLFSIIIYPLRRGRLQVKNLTVKAELLAIAVDESEYGKGYGRKLIGVFETALSQWNTNLYQVSTNINESSSNAFYLAMGFVPVGTIAHHALILQIYEKTFSKRVSVNGR
jgi:GNAT superfamily N-acetyltransferase